MENLNKEMETMLNELTNDEVQNEVALDEQQVEDFVPVVDDSEGGSAFGFAIGAVVAGVGAVVGGVIYVDKVADKVMAGEMQKPKAAVARAGLEFVIACKENRAERKAKRAAKKAAKAEAKQAKEVEQTILDCEVSEKKDKKTK